jgi:acyl carrier protein
MDAKAVEQHVKKSLRMILGINADELDCNQRLVDLGLDSYGFVELITNIEESYGMVFSEDDLISDNFGSIHKIVTFLERKNVSL